MSNKKRYIITGFILSSILERGVKVQSYVLSQASVKIDWDKRNDVVISIHCVNLYNVLQSCNRINFVNIT